MLVQQGFDKVCLFGGGGFMSVPSNVLKESHEVLRSGTVMGCLGKHKGLRS